MRQLQTNEISAISGGTTNESKDIVRVDIVNITMKDVILDQFCKLIGEKNKSLQDFWKEHFVRGGTHG